MNGLERFSGRPIRVRVTAAYPWRCYHCHGPDPFDPWSCLAVSEYDLVSGEPGGQPDVLRIGFGAVTYLEIEAIDVPEDLAEEHRR